MRILNCVLCKNTGWIAHTAKGKSVTLHAPIVGTDYSETSCICVLGVASSEKLLGELDVVLTTHVAKEATR